MWPVVNRIIPAGEPRVSPSTRRANNGRVAGARAVTARALRVAFESRRAPSGGNWPRSRPDSRFAGPARTGVEWPECGVWGGGECVELAEFADLGNVGCIIYEISPRDIFFPDHSPSGTNEFSD